jgi:hypothetical protein
LVTPQSVGIGVTVPALPRVLSSWDGLCPAGLGDCGGGAASCTGGVCVDGAGVPVDSLPLTVSFAPTAVGPVEAVLSVRHDAGGVETVTDVTVRATGVQGQLQVQPAQLVFDEVFVGDSEVLVATVENIGSASVTLAGATVSNTSVFSVQSGRPFPITLAPGQRHSVDVRFTPAAAGQITTTLTWDVQGTAQVPQTSIVGNARLPPRLGLYDDATRIPFDLDAAAVDFGEVYVGRQASRVIRIVNEGAAGSTLAIRRMAIEGPQANRFAITPASFSSTLAGSTNLEPHLELQVTYLSQGVTGFDDEAVLIVESDDPEQPAVEVDLTGRAIRHVITVTPMALDFGVVQVGTSPSPTRTFTVRNDGAGPLVVSAVTAPGLAVYSRTTSVTLPATLQPSGQLTVTVTYTPVTAGVVVSSSLQVQSTDLDRGPVTVTLTGSSGGCPPRANATITLNGSECVYTCNSGFHACGDACLSNTSPDSCGSSCTPCELRSNATRGCAAATSTCTYSCEADARDLDGNLSVAQGQPSNGCEYECPVFPTSPEACNRLDDDCDGVPDDNLPRESPEPADVCGSGSLNLGAILDNNQPRDFTGFKLYPDGDEDTFRFTATENEFNFCFTTEPYRTTIQLLDVPSNRDFDLEVFEDSCSGTHRVSVNGTGASETITIDWQGSSGSDDLKDFFIRVHSFSPSTEPGSCEPYRLRITHDRL